ncbi:hypothetical protein [Nonomuraea sp. NPDC049504]|uniref:hypothetical protein n=1 Tax=Nonomuraea sp. NPDC049504 TaxID=3154729 RepID=UPI00341E952D
MKTQQLKRKAKETATTVAGSAAGAVADPKTASSKIRLSATKPKTLAILSALLTAYLLGRRARRR